MKYFKCISVCEDKAGVFAEFGDLVTNTTDDQTFFLNGTLIYTCPDGMSLYDEPNTADVGPEQNTTCKDDGHGVYDFDPKDMMSCKGN